MKISASLVSGNSDEYRIGFETIESGFLSDEIFNRLKEEGIEIVEVLLERVRGVESTNITVLAEMTNIIHRLFEGNENVILYFFCDDLNEVPSTNKSIEPQEYRSRLFSAMFERFAMKHQMSDVHNVAICIDAIGRTEYLHFIVRDHHQKYIDYIQQNIEETYSK